MPTDLYFMGMALDLAYAAEEAGEVPVGAVLVDAEQKIIGVGANRMIRLSDPTAHAEIIAIRQASQLLQNYRIPESTLYVTLEPCSMCAGAIFHARIQRLVFAARDPKNGAMVSVFQAPRHPKLQISEGILEAESRAALQNFFKARR
ncbi:MAG: tRNA adenosine(34) deaminase TadA [Legionellaceae bacterium]|nr:tRNA adenosine(34) deaminase TadA [Legionellaceae bacterium]